MNAKEWLEFNAAVDYLLSESPAKIYEEQQSRIKEARSTPSPADIQALEHILTALNHFSRGDIPEEHAKIYFDAFRAVKDRLDTFEDPDLKKAAELFQSLSPREVEILKLVQAGRPTKVIAAELEKSENTVRNQISSILTKLKVSNRTQAAALAIHKGPDNMLDKKYKDVIENVQIALDKAKREEEAAKLAGMTDKERVAYKLAQEQYNRKLSAQKSIQTRIDKKRGVELAKALEEQAQSRLNKGGRKQESSPSALTPQQKSILETLKLDEKALDEAREELLNDNELIDAMEKKKFEDSDDFSRSFRKFQDDLKKARSSGLTYDQTRAAGIKEEQDMRESVSKSESLPGVMLGIAGIGTAAGIATGVNRLGGFSGIKTSLTNTAQEVKDGVVSTSTAIAKGAAKGLTSGAKAVGKVVSDPEALRVLLSVGKTIAEIFILHDQATKSTKSTPSQGYDFKSFGPPRSTQAAIKLNPVDEATFLNYINKEGMWSGERVKLIAMWNAASQADKAKILQNVNGKILAHRAGEDVKWRESKMKNGLMIEAFREGVIGGSIGGAIGGLATLAVAHHTNFGSDSQNKAVNIGGLFAPTAIGTMIGDRVGDKIHKTIFSKKNEDEISPAQKGFEAAVIALNNVPYAKSLTKDQIDQFRRELHLSNALTVEDGFNFFKKKLFDRNRKSEASKAHELFSGPGAHKDYEDSHQKSKLGILKKTFLGAAAGAATAAALTKKHSDAYASGFRQGANDLIDDDVVNYAASQHPYGSIKSNAMKAGVVVGGLTALISSIFSELKYKYGAGWHLTEDEYKQVVADVEKDLHKPFSTKGGEPSIDDYRKAIERKAIEFNKKIKRSNSDFDFGQKKESSSNLSMIEVYTQNLSESPFDEHLKNLNDSRKAFTYGTASKVANSAIKGITGAAMGSAFGATTGGLVGTLSSNSREDYQKGQVVGFLSGAIAGGTAGIVSGINEVNKANEHFKKEHDLMEDQLYKINSLITSMTNKEATHLQILNLKDFSARFYLKVGRFPTKEEMMEYAKSLPEFAKPDNKSKKKRESSYYTQEELEKSHMENIFNSLKGYIYHKYDMELSKFGHFDVNSFLRKFMDRYYKNYIHNWTEYKNKLDEELVGIL